MNTFSLRHFRPSALIVVLVIVSMGLVYGYSRGIRTTRNLLLEQGHVSYLIVTSDGFDFEQKLALVEEAVAKRFADKYAKADTRKPLSGDGR